jgi:ubiquinone/menaquinone biosynthesis C-methylase UbiE
MDSVWEKLHSSQEWGKYPAEDIIRKVMRTYRQRSNREKTKVLELGCGAGANLSFFLSEGFQTFGVDGAPSAIKAAHERFEPLKNENQIFELTCSTFDKIDYPDEFFDLVVDYFAIYANSMSVIETTLANAFRLLKPGGRFYSRSWGTLCHGADTGEIFEIGTSKNPESGPCCNMGVSHFFSLEELQNLFSQWSEVEITRVFSESVSAFSSDRSESKPVGGQIEEWVVWAVR